MKTIVIIENEVLERESLVALFEQWQKEINILTASEQQTAISIMSQQQVDLVICDLNQPGKNKLKEFERLTHTFPYVPCITLSSEQSLLMEEVLERGASHCMPKPFDEELLLSHAEGLLEVEASGTVKGIPIHSFLQMLESEGKTCTLEVSKSDDKGYIYVKDGNLIDAETKNFKGEIAAQQVLSWKETWLRLRHFNGQRKLQIKKPLISIIMEAYQLKAKQEKLDEKDLYLQQHQLPLRHLSTKGRKLPLDIGSTVKLEVPELGDLTQAMLVGMLQEKYIIVTNPQPHEELSYLVGSPQRVIIKHIENGKVWMFKSQLLQLVDAPSPLLIFEYPGVIHFHELRKAKRTSIFVPSTCHIDGKKELYGTLIDLSTNGSLCQIKHKTDVSMPQIAINTTVILRCLLPGIKEEQKINGRVKNIKINDSETRVGIEFENLQPHLADTIGKYLFDLEDITT